MGLAAEPPHRKALAQEKSPVLNLKTTRDARANIEVVAGHDLRTAKPDLDAKLPKSVGHDLRTHTAVTMGDGGVAFCWRDGKTLRMLHGILPTLTPDRAQPSRIAA